MSSTISILVFYLFTTPTSSTTIVQSVGYCDGLKEEWIIPQPQYYGKSTIATRDVIEVDLFCPLMSI